MTMVLNSIVIWLKEFKNSWLPETIPHDSPLLQIITSKLLELEQIIIDQRGVETYLDQEEYYRLKLLRDHSSSDEETERRPMLVSTHPSARLERSLPTPPDVHPSIEDEENPEAQAKRHLLEQSPSSPVEAEEEETVEQTEALRPLIRLKRLTSAQIEDYLSRASTNPKSDDTDSSSSDDFRVRIRSRRSLRARTHSNQSSSSKRSHVNVHNRSHDIVINYDVSTEDLAQVASSETSVPSDDQPVSTVLDEAMMETPVDAENHPSTSDALTMEREEVPILQAEPMESSPSAPSSEPNEPVTVPSYSHLLAGTRSSSDSDSSLAENADVNRKRNSKRLLSSSSSESSSKSKKKGSSVIRKPVLLSSLSSDEENDRTFTRRSESKSSTPNQNDSSRIRINRSSSSETETEGRSTRSKTLRKNDDDEEEEEDTMQSSPSKRQGSSQGRKNIRKIIDDQELDIETLDAIEAEKERRNRIAARQKEYNESLLEQSSFLSRTDPEVNGAKNNRLILELNKETNEAIIEVSPKLVQHLKPHQIEGVEFLWNNIFESIEAIEKKKARSNGCILAHCMGLGKTLQVISFIHTILKYSHLTHVQRCLVLCPINAALNWTNEFDHWLKDVDPPIDHYQLTTVRANLRVNHLNYWFEHGGVMIMGYEMYRRLATGVGSKNKKLKLDGEKCLVDPGPDLIIADEGHILKNAQTALARCLAKVKTPRRVVLTGTPLQNNLMEYYCMVSFIKPNLLGTQQEYTNRFVNPIENGQHRDSNEEDVRLMKRRACVLHELLSGFVDRKDYSLLKEYLPPKFEYIINIRLSDLQSTLYEAYLKQQVNQEQRTSVSKKDFKSAKLFADYHYLQRIWTHPFLLYPHFIDRWKKRADQDEENFLDDNDADSIFNEFDDDSGEKSKLKKRKSKKENFKTPKKIEAESDFRGFLIDNIDEPEMRSERRPSYSSTTTTIDSESVENEGEEDEGEEEIQVLRTYPTRSRTVVNPSTAEDSPKDEPWMNAMREQYWFPYLDSLPKESEFDLELSGKFLLLKAILDKCYEIGDKLLLFSRSIYTLDYIERWLKDLHQINEREYQSQREIRQMLTTDSFSCTEPLPEPMRWIRDEDYFRMDGQTDVVSRKRYAKSFNDFSNNRARLFLISTIAGGIGINLTGSNRVIIFDASWNPSHDTQAIFRSYRFGQKKPVYIYRFLAHGTMEEKIYQRQVVKQSLSQRVVDDHQLDRHFTQNDIKELYKFQKEKLPESNTQSALFTEHTTIPKDHLLLDLIYDHHRWIHSYHSHDSLLENRIDEGLTADERRRALEEYESLKRAPDARQLYYQRVQQQQQLNAMIAQHQQMINAQRTNNPAFQAHWSQLIANALRGMPTPPDFSAFFPIANRNDAKPAAPVPPRPIAQRPTTTNDVICIESDDDDDGEGEENQTNKQ